MPYDSHVFAVASNSKLALNPEPSHMGVSQIRGTFLRVHYNKDPGILGSILGSPYFGKLPYTPRMHSEPWRHIRLKNVAAGLTGFIGVI